MNLYLQNTLTGAKQEFKPIHDGTVSMYNCGPTVYSKQHIGNMRPYVFADVLRRTLEYNGYAVKQVMNITDVGHMTNDEDGGADTGEDKMEKAARKSGASAQEIAKRITKEFLIDLEQLSIDKSRIQIPRATEYIAEQIAITQTLEQKGYTYITNDGVYFDTSLFKDYGKLGNIDIRGLEEGARVEKNDEKKNKSDFALWKFSPKEENRQQEWDSPWGTGFPGWHIECSAMSRALLGTHLDIHTGGIDHIPIHHNNEIAQSECSTGKKFVNYWLHSAHILIDGKKISKSLGNTIYLQDLAAKGVHATAYRYWLLTGHYSTQMNFTLEAVHAANTALLKLYKYVEDNLAVSDGQVDEIYIQKFKEYINDDLNTPKALALLWDLLKDNTVNNENKRATVLEFDKVLGLGLSERKKFRLEVSTEPEEVTVLLKEREEARAAEDFAKSDELRDKIKEMGYEVKDTPDGTALSKV